MRDDSRIGLAFGAALFAVYAAGACPTIYVGDSGELVAAVHLLGIPHPTGYPLYCLLGKLWTLVVPFGSVAWRMSLFSAAAGAAACSGLYLLARGLDASRPAALASALLLAFAPSFWGEANVQRVYTLNAAFLVGAVGAALSWERTRAPRRLTLAFFLCGLGATNHTFMAFVAMAIAVFILTTDRAALLQPRRAAAAAGAFALGLLPYAYLPIRSAANPPLDWGNPETLGGFLTVVTRRGFWERSWVESPSDVLAVAADYLGSFAIELAGAGAAFAVVGAAARRSAVRLPLLVMAANLAALAIHGSRSDIFIWHRYYVPSYAMAALLAALGVDAVAARAGRAATAVRALGFAAPAFLVVAGWREFDRSRYAIAEDFSRQLLRSVPAGASLVASDDNVLFVLIYLHFVEGVRPDVRLVLEGVGGADLPPLHFDPDEDALVFTHHPNWNLPALAVAPAGLVFRIVRTGALPPAAPLPKPFLEGENDPRVPRDYLTRNLVGHYHYMIGVTLESDDWVAARREFELAERASPENDVLFYNLGLVFSRAGKLDEAIAAFRRADAINPRHLSSRSRPRAIDRIAEATAERERIAGIERELAGREELRGVDRRSAAYQRLLADVLDARGERVAARGARLTALEIDAAGAAPPN